MKAPLWISLITLSLLGLTAPALAQTGMPRPNTPVEPTEPEEPMGSAADLLVYDADLSTIELEVSQPPSGLFSLPNDPEAPIVGPVQPNNSLIWLPNNEAPSDRLRLSGS